MSHLKYYAYPGYGEHARINLSYNQAVRVGDRIECSGQGGWDPATGEITGDLNTDINAQIDQAFANCDRALRDAGGTGFGQVFRINSYHVHLNDEVVAALVRGMRKWCPDHQPLITVIGVTRLGFDAMRVEIEVSAHDPEGAKKAGVV